MTKTQQMLKTGIIENRDISATAVRKVTRAIPMDVYVVEYLDGEARKQVRLVFRSPAGPDNPVYILQERVEGKQTATAANKWFQKELNNLLDPPKPQRTSRKNKAETVQQV